MDLKQKFKEVYKPIYLDFCDNLRKENVFKELNLEKIPSIHIPGFGEDYPTAKRKILYLGIDTVNWESFSFIDTEKNPEKKIDELILYSCDSLEEYLMIKWWKEDGKTSPFWNIIFKLHLALKGLEFDLSKEELKLHSHDFAWGNTNALQKYEHIEGNPTLTKDQYNKVKQLSLTFNDLETMHSVLSPDVIIIFNGEGKVEADIKKYFKKEESEPKDKRWEKYHHKVSGIPLYWLYHPASGGHFGYHEETVEYFKSQLGVQPINP